VLFQTREAAEILGMEPWQIQSYAKQGLVEPALAGRGAGSRRAYDLLGMVKLALLNRLNFDGFDVRTIRPIFASLFDLPFQLGGADQEAAARRLEEWFEGKVLLTGGRFTVRKLIKRERLPNAAAELLREHCGVYIIDIGRMVKNLLERLRNPGAQKGDAGR
jgi:DNA-binding transcriptional MerR regulator